MNQFIQSKKAFSLIEVIFVLVVLGIVASISSQIIAQVYENYIMQRAVYNVSTKTELVANQIVNRLTYRIQDSTISKNHALFLANQGLANGWATENVNWLPLKDVPVGGIYTTIEWIGYDNDSFDANASPYWTGVADYRNTTASVNGFDSNGSNLNSVAIIMNNLSNGNVNLHDVNPLHTNHAALLFSQNNNYYTGTNEYNPNCMGLIPQDAGSSTNCIFRVGINTNSSFSFLDAKSKIITERYKLAWTAYAIAPEDLDGDGFFDLMLYYNYRPWDGEDYIHNGQKSILMKNVTVFKFSESGGVIRFKLCAAENIGEDFNVTTCKEKVVIR